jgi:DNA mismatch endonuclease (patch repair protein)
MVDRITDEIRRRNMRKIRSTGMKPELAIRKLLHKNGYRYRLHRYDLPGRPDIVFSGRRKIVFVHGCYWHQHDKPACKLAHRPKSNMSYWLPKLERNRRRDVEHISALKALGWSTLVIWECEIGKNPQRLFRRLRRFLSKRFD